MPGERKTKRDSACTSSSYLFKYDKVNNNNSRLICKIQMSFATFSRSFGDTIFYLFLNR